MLEGGPRNVEPHIFLYVEPCADEGLTSRYLRQGSMPHRPRSDPLRCLQRLAPPRRGDSSPRRSAQLAQDVSADPGCKLEGACAWVGCGEVQCEHGRTPFATKQLRIANVREHAL